MSSFRRAWQYVEPYNAIFVLMVITVVLPVAMELAVPRALRYVIDEGIEQSDMQAIWQGVAFMLLAAVLGGCGHIGTGRVSGALVTGHRLRHAQ